MTYDQVVKRREDGPPHRVFYELAAGLEKGILRRVGDRRTGVMDVSAVAGLGARLAPGCAYEGKRLRVTRSALAPSKMGFVVLD